MIRCAVFLTGAIPPRDLGEIDVTICADSGAIPLHERGVVPNYLVGDMDSIPEHILDEMERCGSIIERYPEDKDISDGEAGVRKAVSLDPRRIDIYGGRNGRSDHVLSSYHLLHLVPREIHTSLHLDDDKVILIRCGEELKVTTQRRIISVMPATPECIVSIKGLKWELEREQLKMGSTMGIHNENIGSSFTVRADSGEIYLIMIGDRS